MIIISILAFADEMVIIVESEEKLLSIIKYTENLCKKWRLKLNTDKAKNRVDNILLGCTQKSSIFVN